eukprot:comp20636_c0_seq1/m.26713 comp20636_c0_seq1/g.26713  ORF comp20636_c0_seq1/g.26713 comp20636_c0_seq1/m.26713 type:complete len:890 (-) comp20636_c0_seq1:25-2694(-)
MLPLHGWLASKANTSDDSPTTQSAPPTTSTPQVRRRSSIFSLGGSLASNNTGTESFVSSATSTTSFTSTTTAQSVQGQNPTTPPVRGITRKESIRGARTIVLETWESLPGHMYTALFKTFYRELFLAHPEAKIIFKPKGLHRRSQCFASFLSFCVGEKKVSPTGEPCDQQIELRRLGVQHHEWGTSNELWVEAGRALLTALKLTLRDAWTHRVQMAWFTVVSQVLAAVTGLDTVAERLLCAQTHASTDTLVVQSLEHLPRTSPIVRRVSNHALGSHQLTWEQLDIFDLTLESVLQNPSLYQAFLRQAGPLCGEDNIIFLREIMTMQHGFSVAAEAKRQGAKYTDSLRALHAHAAYLAVRKYILGQGGYQPNISSQFKQAALAEWKRAHASGKVRDVAFLVPLGGEIEQHIMQTAWADFLKWATLAQRQARQNALSLPPTISNHRTRVVVVGGGMGGAVVARELDSDTNMAVTLIDRKTYFEYAAGVWSTLLDGGQQQGNTVPYSSILKNGRFVCGEVTSVRAGSVVVNMEEIPFDFCVYAVGHQYPQYVTATEPTLDARTKTFCFERARLAEARTVFVSGGGIVAVELAARLAAAYKNKKIVFAYRYHTFCPHLAPSFHAIADAHLRSLPNLRILMAERMGEVRRQAGGQYVVQVGGRKASFDVVYLMHEPRALTDFLRSSPTLGHALDDKGYLQVSWTLQVVGHTRIFALGDAAGLPIEEVKAGAYALRQAPIVLENIRRMARTGGAPIELVKYNREFDPLTALVQLDTNVGILYTGETRKGDVGTAKRVTNADELRRKMVVAMVQHVADGSVSPELHRWLAHQPMQRAEPVVIAQPAAVRPDPPTESVPMAEIKTDPSTDPNQGEVPLAVAEEGTNRQIVALTPKAA